MAVPNGPGLHTIGNNAWYHPMRYWFPPPIPAGGEYLGYRSINGKCQGAAGSDDISGALIEFASGHRAGQFLDGSVYIDDSKSVSPNW